MKPTRRTVLLTSALTLLASVVATDIASAQQPGSGRTIRYSQSNALGATYISDQVAIAALEKLGYKVNVTVLAPAAFLQSASQGDMDMSTSINFPQSAVPYQRVEKQLALVGDGSIIGGGVNGYMVDKKTAEAHKITSVDQLKDPKLAALFDNNRSGKATLINCDPGWSCGDVVEFQLDKFGLTGTVRSVRGKYEALMGETFARYRAGEPVLFYGWSPGWVVDTLRPGRDVVWLPTPFEALPPGVVAPKGALVSGVVGCAGGQDPCRMTIGAWNYQSIVNRTFLAENPAVRKLAEQFRFPLSAWIEWEGTISKTKNDRDIKKAAETWIAQNQAQFDGWVKEAAAAK
jgi:glycine betaine/proline transport system substrate-binding protein